MIMTSDEAISYLTDRRDSLNITNIARQADMPDSTLRKAVNGERPLPARYERSLCDVVEKLKGGTV